MSYILVSFGHLEIIRELNFTPPRPLTIHRFGIIDLPFLVVHMFQFHAIFSSGCLESFVFSMFCFFPSMLKSYRTKKRWIL